ncbi:hypothetical protein ONZ45_g9674 [Pleurotus djamor]|nr:hypothetical protein ONZ45_g9674 [Pleurotus djamor]
MGAAQSTPVSGELSAILKNSNRPDREETISAVEIRLISTSNSEIVLENDTTPERIDDLSREIRAWTNTGGMGDAYVVNAKADGPILDDTEIAFELPSAMPSNFDDSSSQTASGIITHGLTNTNARPDDRIFTVIFALTANHSTKEVIESASKKMLLSSRVEKLRPETTDVRPSATLEDLVALPGISNLIRRFDERSEALRALKSGIKYAFVCLSDGSIMAIETGVVEAIGGSYNYLQFSLPTCLKPAHVEDYSSGTIETNIDGTICHFECLSEGSLVPLELPFNGNTVLHIASPILSHILSILPASHMISKVLMYSPTFVMLACQLDPSWVNISNVRYFISYHEHDRVHIIGVDSKATAHALYQSIPNQWAKIAIDRYHPKTKIASSGTELFTQQCEAAVERLRPFVKSEGLHLTTPLTTSPFVIAFHHQGSIKMLGSSSEDTAWKLYSHVSQDCARALVDRRTSEVLASYGISKWTSLCEDCISQLPPVDTTVPLLSATYIVAFLQGNEVMAIGYDTLEAARDTYNSISMSWAKTLRSSAQLVSSHGHKEAVQLCNDQVTSLFSTRQVAPYQNSSHVVALHIDPMIRLIGFSSEKACQDFFDVVSSTYARVCMNTSENRVKIQAGGDYFVELLPASETKYVVSCHAKDNIYLFACASRDSASRVYEVISNSYAKLVVDVAKAEVVSSYGAEHFRRLCESRVRDVLALNRTASLYTATFVVAFTVSGQVKLVGLSSLLSAQCLYHALLEDVTKVIVYRRSLKALFSEGPQEDVNRCAQRVYQLGALDDGVPLAFASHLVIFHIRDTVVTIGFSNGDASRMFYYAISKDWAKVLLEGSEVLSKHGRDSMIEECITSPRRDIAVSLERARFLLAFHVEDSVGILGFSDEIHAFESYEAISSKWAKVLFNRVKNEIILRKHDLANNISQLYVQDLRDFVSTPLDDSWSSIVVPSNYNEESEANTIPMIVEAISLMRNLVSLIWMPRLLHPDVEPLIWKAVQHCKSLQNLSVNYPPPWYFGLIDLTNPLWSIAGLTSLTLENVSSPISHKHGDCIKSLFKQSAGLETLTVNNRGISGILPNTPFSRLRRLSYRTSTRDYIPLSLRPCPCLTTFLDSHPSLEDVEWFDSFPALLSDDALPSLRRLWGTDLTNGVTNILNTPSAQKRQIESIGRLRLSPQVFHGLSQIHAQSLLRIDVSHFPIIEDIGSLADMFPNLTWLRVPSRDYRDDYADVTTKPIMTAEWPDLISRFDNLEVFHGVSFFMDPLDAEENLERASYLRTHCPNLTEVDHWDSDAQMIIRISTAVNELDPHSPYCSDSRTSSEPKYLIQEVGIRNLEDRYAWRADTY